MRIVPPGGGTQVSKDGTTGYLAGSLARQALLTSQLLRKTVTLRASLPTLDPARSGPCNILCRNSGKAVRCDQHASFSKKRTLMQAFQANTR